MRKPKSKPALIAAAALSLATWLGGAWMILSMKAAAQDAGDAAAPGNLQVLPTGSSRASVRGLMKQFERELGVSCSYCHVEDRDSGVIDYASDDNPRKHTARLMIAMLKDINDKHLAQLGGDRRYAQPATCGSCHRGQATPQAFEP
jgi:hypothetical protein